MIGFMDDDSLTVPPLSRREKAWIHKFQKVLSECPDRLEMVVTGDADVTIVDAEGARRSELCDGAARRDGVALANVGGKPLFHGVSG